MNHPSKSQNINDKIVRWIDVQKWPQMEVNYMNCFTRATNGFMGLPIILLNLCHGPGLQVGPFHCVIESQGTQPSNIPALNIVVKM